MRLESRSRVERECGSRGSGEGMLQGCSEGKHCFSPLLACRGFVLEEQMLGHRHWLIYWAYSFTTT